MRRTPTCQASTSIIAIASAAFAVTAVTPADSSAKKAAHLRTLNVVGPTKEAHMSPTGSRFASRRILASAAVIGAFLISSASISGCQTGTAASPYGSQAPTQVSGSAASPLPDPTPTVPAPPVAVTSTVAAPPPARQVAAPRIAAVAPAPLRSAQENSSCVASSYRNSDGNCIPRPQQAAAAPAGATAQCSDGDYSFSQHRRGTCSGHGGVAQWL